MKCYVVIKTEAHWDEPEREVVGNAVYGSPEDARDAAEAAFDRFLADHPYVEESGRERDRPNGYWHAYTRGESCRVTVEEYEFVPAGGETGGQGVPQ